MKIVLVFERSLWYAPEDNKGMKFSLGNRILLLKPLAKLMTSATKQGRRRQFLAFRGGFLCY